MASFVKGGLSIKELLALDDPTLNQTILLERTVPSKDERYQRIAPELPYCLKELNRTDITHFLLWSDDCRKEYDPRYSSVLF